MFSAILQLDPEFYNAMPLCHPHRPGAYGSAHQARSDSETLLGKMVPYLSQAEEVSQSSASTYDTHTLVPRMLFNPGLVVPCNELVF